MRGPGSIVLTNFRKIERVPDTFLRFIVERLEREIGAVLKRPETQAQFDKIGLETGGPTRQELPAFVKSQIASWAVAAQDAGIQKQ